MSKRRDANGFIQWSLGPYLAQLDCQGTFVERKAVRVLRRILQRELTELADLETLDCWQEDDPRHCIRKDGTSPLRLVKLATSDTPEEVYEFASRADAARWVRGSRWQAQKQGT